MAHKATGFAFRVTGLILGIIGASISVVAIVFSAIGLHRSRRCKHCKMEELYK